MDRAQLTALVHATGVAESHGGWTFLRDPHWTPAQSAAFAEVIRSCGPKTAAAGAGWLCIPTGGSSGGLKFARHDEATLGAAARGFGAHFAIGEVNAVDVLPPWHVSGLMARVRCAVTGGRHRAWEWKRLEAGERPSLEGGRPWVISLVPTQLQRLLAQPAAVTWLRGFVLIFLGGGPSWAGLVDAAVGAGLPVVLSYGMTETAAMVCAQQPADAAAGDRSAGSAMPQAHLMIEDDATGMPQPAGTTGRIVIQGESVMRGYLGADEVDGTFRTADHGWLDAAGRLTVLGRSDDVIITGGEKVRPGDVESALRGTGLFEDVAVIGRPHPEWGEEVVGCYRRDRGALEAAEIERALGDRLSRHLRPKHWLHFTAESWPRNAQGKVNRAELRTRVSALRDPRG